MELNVVESVYWTPAGNPHPEYASFDDAVAGARDRQSRIDLDWPSRAGHAPRYSREFVALRQKCTYAPQEGVASGNDRELLRWEVFPECVVLVPDGQGGLTDEQRDAALTHAARKSDAEVTRFERESRC